MSKNTHPANRALVELKAYATTAGGARESLRLLARFYGLPPWKPALKLQVDSLKTRRGFKTFRLSPVA